MECKASRKEILRMKIKHRAHRQNNGGVATETEPRVTDGQEHAEAMETASSAIGESEIAALAYHYWQERECPEGCPEEDWLRAERELTSMPGRIS
jgi:hypothetical protein